MTETTRTADPTGRLDMLIMRAADRIAPQTCPMEYPILRPLVGQLAANLQKLFEEATRA